MPRSDRPSPQAERPLEAKKAATPAPLDATRGPASVSGEHAFGFDFGQIAVQPKLEVGDPNDPLESEADRAAEAVVGATEEESGNVEDGEEETVNAAPGMPDPGDAGSGTVQRKAQPGNVIAGGYEGAVEVARGGGRPLSASESAFMAPRFGVDFSRVRIHDDSRAGAAATAVGARAYTAGHDIVLRGGAYREGTTSGRLLLAHELAHVIQQQHGGAAPLLRRKPAEKPPAFRFTVTPQAPTDATGFRILVCTQILGVDAAAAAEYAQKLDWTGPHSTGGVEQSDVGKPIRVSIAASLYRSVKGAPRPEGEGVDESGRAEQAGARAAEFDALPKPERDALHRETDLRFWARTNYKPGQLLGKSEEDKQMAALWLDIRDEVLVQRQQLQTLPVEVRQVLGGVPSFKTADFPQLLRIAGKMSPGEWADYISRVNAQTSDLDQLEASVDAFLTEKRAREEGKAELKEQQKKLAGTESLYRQYQDYLVKKKAATGRIVPARGGPVRIPATQSQLDAAAAAEKSLTDALVVSGFPGGIPEYETALRDFLKAFEAQALQIGFDVLDRYDSFLYHQEQLYQSDVVISALYDSLAPFREAQGEFAKQKEIMDTANAEYKGQSEQSRLPGSGHIRPDPALKEKADAAHDQAKIAKGKAISTVQGVTSAHPIFSEEHLPLTRRIDKEQLAKADPGGIKALLQKHIADRRTDVRDTRADLKSDPELIYKMPELFAEAAQQFDVVPGSVFYEIVQEKAKQIERDELVLAILIAVLGVAFAIMTFGTGAIALIGAGGGLLVSGGTAYREFEKFRIASSAAGSGLSSTEPSPMWLVLSVVGVVIDAAFAVRVVNALRGPAMALEATGDLDAFRKAVQLLEQQGEINARIARSVEVAGEAREAYKAATREFLKASSKGAYSVPGPLADPDVYVAVVKMAAAKGRQGYESVQQFILELNRLRVEAKLAELGGEELVIAKKAFEEGTESAKIGTYSTRIQWGIHNVEARPFGKGFFGKRTPQTKARVDAYELKINPNNESFFLPHPGGGYVQFENVASTTVQDGKLVMSAKSQYHVADMPSFAKEGVLAAARRQVAAADAAGYSVEWLVSEQKALTQLQDLFTAENVKVTLRLLPE